MSSGFHMLPMCSGTSNESSSLNSWWFEMAERSWQTQVYFSHRSPDWKHKYTATCAQVMLETSWNWQAQHRRFLATICPCICASILCSLMYTPLQQYTHVNLCHHIHTAMVVLTNLALSRVYNHSGPPWICLLYVYRMMMW